MYCVVPLFTYVLFKNYGILVFYRKIIFQDLQKYSPLILLFVATLIVPLDAIEGEDSGYMIQFDSTGY